MDVHGLSTFVLIYRRVMLVEMHRNSRGGQNVKNEVFWNMTFIFPFSWECHHPNWRTHIFQRGRYTTNQKFTRVYTIIYPIIIPWNHHWITNKMFTRERVCLYMSICMNSFNPKANRHMNSFNGAPENAPRWRIGELTTKFWARIINEGCYMAVFGWLVVWNMFYFPIYFGNNHSNWLIIFFRRIETTNQYTYYSYMIYKEQMGFIWFIHIAAISSEWQPS